MEGTSGVIDAAVYKENNYFKKTGWSYLEINLLNFFFPPVNLVFGNGLLPKSYLVLHAIKNGCVYASQESRVSGAVGLNHMCIFFYVFKMLPLGGVKEERLT